MTCLELVTMRLILGCSAAVILLGLVLSAPQKPSHFKNRGIRIRDQDGLGITGGSPADIEKFPYQASISTTYGYYIGSGSIIGKRFILVSAQEVLWYDATDFVVRVGSNNVTEGGQTIAVEEIIIHSHFSYDVALLKLAEPIKYNQSVKPIKLATKEVRNGTSAVLTGFGTTAYVGDDHNFLQGTLRLLDREACQPYYIYKFNKSFMCAYSPTVCACNYDLADPLVYKNKLIGFFVGGSYCCTDTNPQVFSSVPGFQKWIKKQMKKRGFNATKEAVHYFKETV